MTLAISQVSSSIVSVFSHYYSTFCFLLRHRMLSVHLRAVRPGRRRTWANSSISVPNSRYLAFCTRGQTAV